MVIIARDMLTAQGFQLSTAERDELVARADKVRQVISEAQGYACTERQTMHVPVKAPQGAHIGYLTYHNL